MRALATGKRDDDLAEYWSQPHLEVIVNLHEWVNDLGTHKHKNLVSQKPSKLATSVRSGSGLLILDRHVSKSPPAMVLSGRYLQRGRLSSRHWLLRPSRRCNLFVPQKDRA